MAKGSGRGNSPTGSITDAAAVTPADSALTDAPTRAVYVGGAGNLAVTFVDGTTVTFVGVPAGTLLPIAVKEILATNTTATSILALF